MAASIDPALMLRMRIDGGENLPEKDILAFLSSSELVTKLTSSFSPLPLFAIWRLLALAEIPGAENLPYTKDTLNYTSTQLGHAFGFSLTGKEDDLVPCYNAMLLEAYCKLGQAQAAQAKAALQWIVDYQPFVRGITSAWDKSGVKKYGGCLHGVPCFIGVSKSLKALLIYKKYTNCNDAAINVAIEKGIDYLLMHQMYKKISNQKPISAHITDLFFPQAYPLGILDLLEIGHLADILQMPECSDIVDYIASLQREDGHWPTTYVYKYSGYVAFDGSKQRASWITHLIKTFIS